MNPYEVQRIRARARAERAGAEWFSIRNAAGDGDKAAEVVIYDEIGWFGVTAADFLAQLKEITAPRIDLRLNSPGGEIFDGIAIYNVLRNHDATVTTYVDSLAASAASVIAMAGDEIVMAPYSQMMIHDAWGLVVGNAADMHEMADMLDRQSANLASVYADRAGGTVAEWRARMQDETWYFADEAVEVGLADRVDRKASAAESEGDGRGGKSAKAKWDLSVFKFSGREHAPAPRAAVEPAPVDEPEPTPAPEPDPEPEPAVPAAVAHHANSFLTA